MGWLLALAILGAIFFLFQKNVDRETGRRMRSLGKVTLLIAGLIVALVAIISLESHH